LLGRVEAYLCAGVKGSVVAWRVGSFPEGPVPISRGSGVR